MSLHRESSMEVDPPAQGPSTPGTAGSSGSGLKRSNSAPMINVLVSTAEVSSAGPSSTSQISPPLFSGKISDRTRRFSSSSMCLNSPSITAPAKVPDRVNRLKQEEIHIEAKEKQHEKEISSAIRMSTSWDEFSLDDHEPMMSEHGVHKRPRSFSESLHIFTSPSFVPGAPSPTRIGKQCFSPSMQIPVKNNSFTPSPSPSPTRKTFLRSLSPIAVGRPTPLGKRRLESDHECYLSPPKKFHSGPSTPDKMIAHPLAHSISSSSLDESSADQTVPRSSSLPNVPTHTQPPAHMFGFMPLPEAQDMQTTDSETSDLNESTDISDQNLSLSSSPGNGRGFQPVGRGQVPL